MRKLIKIPVYLIILFIIAVLSGLLTIELISFGRVVEVPDLKGKNMIEASDILKGKGLHIRFKGEDYDLYIPEGHIIRQNVPPNSSVKEGREVGVVLSRGARLKFVPDVVGLPLNIAESILKARGIRIRRVLYVHSDHAAKDIILAQRPEPDELGRDVFSVIVSMGSYD